MSEEDYLFEEIERNNGTCLTPEEIEKVDQAFQAFDKDNNGHIDSDELRSVLESTRQIITPPSDGPESHRGRCTANDGRGRPRGRAQDWY